MGLLSLFGFLVACTGVYFARELTTTKHRVAIATHAPREEAHASRYTVSRSTGLWLHYEKRVPRDAVAVAVFVGGFAGHIDEYRLLFDFLASARVAVVAADHQGRGGSEGERGWFERFSHLVDDVDGVVSDLVGSDASISGLPRFLVGVSMGGTVSVSLAQRNARAWSGVVLLGGMLAPTAEFAAPWKLRLAEAFSEFLPRFPVAGFASDDTTHSVEHQDAFARDPRSYQGLVLARMGGEGLRALLDIHSAWPSLRNTPMLLLQGEQDPICDASGAQQAIQALEKLGNTNVDLHILPNSKHDIFFEPQNTQRVMKDVTDFIHTHAARGKVEEDVGQG